MEPISPSSPQLDSPSIRGRAVGASYSPHGTVDSFASNCCLHHSIQRCLNNRSRHLSTGERMQSVGSEESETFSGGHMARIYSTYFWTHHSANWSRIGMYQRGRGGDVQHYLVLWTICLRGSLSRAGGYSLGIVDACGGHCHELDHLYPGAPK